MCQELFFETPIPDLVIYKPRLFRDERGYFCESFNSKHFVDVGMGRPFIQDNRSFSKKGTLRGMHLQQGDSAQAKLVGVLKGQVYDAVVDLRPESKTFGESFGITLDASEDPRFLYVPRGFAHGFLVLSDEAEFYYKVDNFYDKESESGLRFDDPELGIKWPKVDVDFVLSSKDKELPSFKEYVERHGGV